MRILMMTLLFVFPLAASAVDRTEEEILSIVQEHSPEQLENLQRLKALDSRRYERALDRINQSLDRRDAHHSQRRLQLMTLRAEFNALGEAGAEAEGDEREEIRTEMVEIANQHFDIKMQAHQETIQNLQERIAALEGQIAERQEQRDELIDAQVARALGEE